MNNNNYIYYLNLIIFCFFILIATYIGPHLRQSSITKETIAKVATVSVIIDLEVLQNLNPANEPKL